MKILRTSRSKAIHSVSVVIFAASLWLGSAAAPTARAADPEVIRIGVLMALSGHWGSIGQASVTALEEAQEDLNIYLDQNDANMRIDLIVEDTHTDPDIARTKLEELIADNVRVVIGPGTSAELEAVKPIADENGIVLISNGSTAPSLSLDDDRILRFIPDDTRQAKAVAKLMSQKNVVTVIPIWRGDVYGDDLVAATKKEFRSMGGYWRDGVRYDPDTTDFKRPVLELKRQVQQALAKGFNVAVYAIAFDEIVEILRAAQDVELLDRCDWYGSDSSALNQALLKDPTVAAYAAKVNLLNPIYTHETDQKTFNAMFHSVRSGIHATLGTAPEPYALAAWDALWVSTLAYRNLVNFDDPDLILNAIINSASNYQGLLGLGTLNENGDRYTGKYGFFAIVRDGDDYEWTRQATCHFESTFPPYITYP